MSTIAKPARSIEFERIEVLQSTKTGETCRVRVLREMPDRYVIGSTRKGNHWVAPLMKTEWRTTHSAFDKACVVVALSLLAIIVVVGVILAIGGPR